MLGAPTRAALLLPSTPAFYVHDAAVTQNRRSFIEDLYGSLNEAGTAAGLDHAATAALVAEAECAFALNAELYREAAPVGTGLGACLG